MALRAGFLALAKGGETVDANAERYHVQRAVRIIRRFIENERAMRERVLRHTPRTQREKLAECDQALRAFEWLMERLYAARPDLRPVAKPQAEQLPLVEVEG